MWLHLHTPLSLWAFTSKYYLTNTSFPQSGSNIYQMRKAGNFTDIVMCSMKTWVRRVNEWCLWLLSIAVIKTLRREGFLLKSGQEPESKTCKGAVEHCWLAHHGLLSPYNPGPVPTQGWYLLKWAVLCRALPTQFNISDFLQTDLIAFSHWRSLYPDTLYQDEKTRTIGNLGTIEMELWGSYISGGEFVLYTTGVGDYSYFVIQRCKLVSNF